jgi:hypothetical protein
MDRFVTGQGAPSSPEGAEILTRVDPTLDRPMIRFQDVIEVLHRSVLAVLLQSTDLDQLQRLKIVERRILNRLKVRLSNPRLISSPDFRQISAVSAGPAKRWE